MHRGYIKLWRRLQSNELWKERRKFSKAEAWIDLLLEARHNPEPGKIIIGNRTLICNRGQSLKSLETWALRWGWSRSKVRRVLHLFQKSTMIRYENETVTVRISICNYDKYDNKRNDNETQKKRK